MLIGVGGVAHLRRYLGRQILIGIGGVIQLERRHRGLIAFLCVGPVLILSQKITLCIGARGPSSQKHILKAACCKCLLVIVCSKVSNRIQHDVACRVPGLLLILRGLEFPVLGSDLFSSLCNHFRRAAYAQCMCKLRSGLDL